MLVEFRQSFPHGVLANLFNYFGRLPKLFRIFDSVEFHNQVTQLSHVNLGVKSNTFTQRSSARSLCTQQKIKKKKR